MTRVDPKLLVDVISVTPAMRPNCVSKGVATEVAMISALAPGRDACTEIVGNSTCGSDETGNKLNAIKPAIARPIASSVVPIGRLINGAERFIMTPALIL